MAARREYRQTDGRTLSLSDLLSSSMDAGAANGESARKARRAHQVKSMYKMVIEQMFQNSPATAKLFLDHTNAVYIIRETDQKTNVESKVLIVYVDESIFAAELNGRRELVKMKFELLGEKLSEFRILVSRGEYKKNHPFEVEEANVSRETFQRRELSGDEVAEIEREAAEIQDEKIKSAFLRAAIEVKSVNTAPDTRNINNRV